MVDSSSEITDLLSRIATGNAPECEARLYELVHDELAKIARARLRREPGQAISSQQLVDDAFRKVVGKVTPESRNHFYRLAARAMRQLLIDHARIRRRRRETLNDPQKLAENEDASPLTADQVLEVHDALEVFRTIDPRAAEVVQFLYFGGFTQQKTAELLGVSVSTVKGDWQAARAWLKRELS